MSFIAGFFNKMIAHVRAIGFEASALLKLYEILPEENNVTYSCHLTRFIEDILNAVSELEKTRGTKQKGKLYLKMDINNLVKEVMNPNSFVEQLIKFAILIRKAIFSSKIILLANFLRTVRKIQTEKTAFFDMYAH